MKPWLAAGLCTAAATALLIPQPVVSGQSAALRERSQVSNTVGTLARIGEKRVERLAIDADGNPLPSQSYWETDPVTGAQYRKGELLVQFEDGVEPSARAQAARTAGASRMPVSMARNWELLDLSSATNLREAAEALRRQPGVAQVSLNYRAVGQQVRPNDEHFGLQWNFNAVNLPLAWEISPGATSDVIVAVIDTGFNTTTATLTFSTPIGQIPIRFGVPPDSPNDARIIRAFDFVYRDDTPVDLDGHGTHVSGTIAQQTNNAIGVAGVAYNVGLMPLKVLGGDWDDVLFPANPGGSFAVIAEAIRYAADNGAKVINLSLGGRAPSLAARDAISYAVGRGAFVAIAAGNDGDDGNPIEYPAAYGSEIDGAMTVGAVSRALRRAEYSGFHPYVEICAPGGEVQFANDFDQGITQITYDDGASLTYLFPSQMIQALRSGIRPQFDQFIPVPFQGTSMATPHVAGVAALLYSQGIRTPRAIEQAIKRFATPISARPDECGAGLIDARRAVRGLGIGR